MQLRLIFILGIVFLINFTACKNNTPEKTEKSISENIRITGISVWDRISAKSEPLRNAPRASLLSLGESFIYLDTFAIDSSSNNTKFLKVRLSDSTDVWVYDFASVLYAKPAVVTEEVPLYLRPDLLTISDTRLHIMEIVAVVEEWDDWIKVVNEKKENTGWIKKNYLRYEEVDLAFSLLVKRVMEIEDSEQKIDKLEDLLENNPYPNTIFIADLRTILDAEKELMREREYEDDRENQDRRDRNR